MDSVENITSSEIFIQQSISDDLTLIIQYTVLGIGFTWQFSNSLYALMIARTKQNAFNTVICFSQYLYIIAFILAFLKVWAINQFGNNYRFFHHLSAIDSQYQVVLFIGKFQIAFILLSTFTCEFTYLNFRYNSSIEIDTICVQIRFTKIRVLFSYDPIYDTIANTITLLMFSALILLNFVVVKSLSSPITAFIISFWFIFILVVDIFSVKMFTSHIVKVSFF
jgi:hypothetical protein